MESSKSKENCSQFKTYKYYKDRINFLLNEIQIEEYKKEDIPIMIMLFLSKKNFRSSPPKDIIKYISNPDLFPSLTLLINLKDDIMNALKSNKMFKFFKKKVKLDLEKSLNYLESYCQKNIKKKSPNSKEIPAKVIDFPLSESDDENELASSFNQVNMFFSFGENIDNTINVGKYSQIKVSNKKKSNLNNLFGENEKDKKDIVDKEGLSNMFAKIIFDEKECFQNIKNVVSEFFICCENINNDKAISRTLDERIKKLNELFFEVNTKVNLFNELSECFDGVKNGLFDCKYMIEKQLYSLRFICEKDCFTMDQYAGERKMYFSYLDMFKKMVDKLKEIFSEAGMTDRNIRLVKFKIIRELKRISEEFKLAEIDEKFHNLIKNSINTMPLLVVIENMKETLNLFNSSVVEYEKSFAEIEEISKKKKSEI